MKTLLPVLGLVCLVALFAGSSVLYINMDYVTSALLTASWIIGIAGWIGYWGRQKETSK